jgi:protein-tyrosine phosphatase
LQKKTALWSGFAVLLTVFAVIQFIPTAPLVVPSELPPDQRESHRLLNFQGIANFRDLGGYPTDSGRAVKWGVLYRSATLADSTPADLAGLDRLGLSALVDFRSEAEKQEEPNRLPDPPGFRVVDIPILDEGNQALVGEIMARIDTGDFDDFDPDAAMMTANRQFASEFTPQFRQFIHTVLEASGRPVAWHCSAGKDRTGFAAAILLRILGVPKDVIMRDYLASREHALDARRNQLLLLRLFKGETAADKLSVMMGVEEDWLAAAFDEIDSTWGSFDAYVREGLQLDASDVARLQQLLLD